MRGGREIQERKKRGTPRQQPSGSKTPDRQARDRREVTLSVYDEAPYVLSPTCELSVSLT